MNHFSGRWSGTRSRMGSTPTTYTASSPAGRRPGAVRPSTPTPCPSRHGPEPREIWTDQSAALRSAWR